MEEQIRKLKIKVTFIGDLQNYHSLYWMVRSTLLFLLLQKFWGTLKSVQGPPTFDMFSSLLCSIWKLFCRPFSILFRFILAVMTHFNSTVSIFEMVSKSGRTNSKNWKIKITFLEIPKIITVYLEINQKYTFRCVRRMKVI